MSTFSYSATGLPAGLSLDPLTGTITGAPTQAGAFSCVVTATNHITNATASFPWSGSVDPNLPTPVGTLPAGTTGQSYSQVLTLDGYAVAPVTIDASAGTIPAWMSCTVAGTTITCSGTPPAAGTFNFTLRATDSSTPPRAGSGSAQSVVITDAPFTLSGTLASGSYPEGAAYSSTLTLGGTFTPPVTIDASAGALPGWMTVSVSGNTVTFSGTAVGAGTVSFTPRATDSATPTSRVAVGSAQSFTVTANPITITGGPLPNATVGVAYSSTLTLGGYYVAPVTIDVSTGAMPGWMSASASGSVITFSGSPDVAGTFNFTPRATDSSTPARTGTAAAQTVVVSAPAITWTSVSTGVTKTWAGVISGGGKSVVFTANAVNSGIAEASLVSADGGHTWGSPGTPPASVGYKWAQGAYGNGLFVLLQAGGTNYATSPDGATWTTRTLPYAAQGWGTLVFANGLFVLPVRYDVNGYMPSDIYTSPDGITWTHRTYSNSANCTGVAYGNGTFVIVSNGGNVIVTSPDGITWTPHVISGSWTSLVFSAGVFVAFDGSKASTSTDGVTWTAAVNVPLAGGSYAWKYSAATNNVILATSDLYAQYLVSNDGVSWNRYALPAPLSAGGPVAGSGTVFVMVSGTTTVGLGAT